MEPVTKQRLHSYIFLRRSVENQLERLARMKNDELIPAMKEGDGSKRTPGASDRMANAIIRRLAYEDEVMNEVEEKMAEMEAIRAAILGLHEAQEQEVLRCRYIDCEGFRHTPWKDVAIQIYGDDDESQVKAVQRIHGRALINLLEVKL